MLYHCCSTKVSLDQQIIWRVLLTQVSDSNQATLRSLKQDIYWRIESSVYDQYRISSEYEDTLPGYLDILRSVIPYSPSLLSETFSHRTVFDSPSAREEQLSETELVVLGKSSLDRAYMNLAEEVSELLVSCWPSELENQKLSINTAR